MAAEPVAPLASPSQQPRLGAALVTLAFAAISLPIVLHHAMWRDEMQAWLLARDSGSVLDLLHNLKYEGHPPLWHLLLMPLTRLFASPMAMQLLHLGISSTTVYVLVRHAPFSWPKKLLLVLSYYLFYEYSVLARNYSLAVLAIFLFCAGFPARHRRFLPVVLALCFLTQTNAFGLVMAIVLAGALALELVVDRARLAEQPNVAARRYIGGLIVVALFIALAIDQVRPPADSMFVGWQFGLTEDAFRRTSYALVGGYAPVPMLVLNYWNSDILLYTDPGLAVAAVVVVVILVVLYAVTLADRPLALLVYAGCTLSILAFLHIVLTSHALRHYGYLFIALVMSEWLRPSCREVVPPLAVLSRRLARFLPAGLGLLFAVQAVSGVLAAGMDRLFVFSNASRVADYLQHGPFADRMLAAWKDFSATAIVGYLGDRPFYYPESRHTGSFIRWDRTRQTISAAEVIERARREGERLRKPVVLVVNQPIDPTLARQQHLVELAHFQDAVVYDENFWVYEIE